MINTKFTCIVCRQLFTGRNAVENRRVKQSNNEYGCNSVYVFLNVRIKTCNSLTRELSPGKYLEEKTEELK